MKKVNEVQNFVLGLEKANTIKKTMRKLYLPNGNTATDPELIFINTHQVQALARLTLKF